jgi:DNA-binding transcriptional MocR family regulator
MSWYLSTPRFGAWQSEASPSYERLLKRGITIAPGPMFSASQRYGNCMRLSIGQPWSERQERALREVGRLAQQFN